LPQAGTGAPLHPLSVGRCGTACTPEGFAALIARQTRVLDQAK